MILLLRAALLFRRTTCRITSPRGKAIHLARVRSLRAVWAKIVINRRPPSSSVVSIVVSIVVIPIATPIGFSTTAVLVEILGSGLPKQSSDDVIGSRESFLSLAWVP
ncbi:hypothetical protein K456DRAFT_42871 [Colletotrichum gloeosporioides 23]|nr:hypothetical protein K456DRAFT_42871 [Colletotrichum gloeosporioides 23]